MPSWNLTRTPDHQIGHLWGVVSIVHVVPCVVVPALEPFLGELHGTCQHTETTEGWVGAAVEASLIWALPSMICTRNHQDDTFHLSHLSPWASQIPRSVARAKKPWLLPSKLLAWQRLDTSGWEVWTRNFPGRRRWFKVEPVPTSILQFDPLCNVGFCGNPFSCHFYGRFAVFRESWTYLFARMVFHLASGPRHRKWCRVNFNILAIEVSSLFFPLQL